MKNLTTRFFLVCVVVSGNACANSNSQNFAEDISRKVGIPQMAAEVWVQHFVRKYNCFDENFKSQGRAILIDAAKADNVDEKFVLYLQNNANENDLKNIDDFINSTRAAEFLDDLRNPKYDANNNLIYPSISKSSDKDLKMLSNLTSKFSSEFPNDDIFKKYDDKANALAESYLMKENGTIQCNLQPVTSN